MQDGEWRGEIGLSFSYLLHAISSDYVLKLNFRIDKYAFHTVYDLANV